MFVFYYFYCFLFRAIWTKCFLNLCRFFSSLFSAILLKSSKSIPNKIVIYAVWIELKDTHTHTNTDHIEWEKSVKRTIWSKLLKFFICFVAVFFFCRQRWVTDPVFFFEKKYLNSFKLTENPWIWNSTTFKIQITAHFFLFHHSFNFAAIDIFVVNFHLHRSNWELDHQTHRKDLVCFMPATIYSIFAISKYSIGSQFCIHSQTQFLRSRASLSGV